MIKRVLLLVILPIFLALPAWGIDITVQWTANIEPDLAGYNLYYGGSAGGPYSAAVFDIQDPSTTEYTVVGLADDQNYFFVLTAYDTEGLESGYSNEDSTVAYWERQTPGPPTEPQGCLIKAVTP